MGEGKGIGIVEGEVGESGREGFRELLFEGFTKGEMKEVRRERGEFLVEVSAELEEGERGRERGGEDLVEFGPKCKMDEGGREGLDRFVEAGAKREVREGEGEVVD